MLRKQLVPINFGALDEKTESKALAPGGMTRVVNAERNKTGRFDKRTGYATAISTTYLDSSGSATASNLKALGSTGNSIFALDGDDSGNYSFLGYSEEVAKFVDKGDFIPVAVESRKLDVGNANPAQVTACASNGDYTCVAWSQRQGPSTNYSYYLYMRVLDNATKEVIASKEASLTTTPGGIQVAELSGKFHVFTQNGNNAIHEYTWDGSTPTTDGTDFTTVGSIAADLKTNTRFIVKNSGTYLVLLYADTGNAMQLSRSTGSSWSSLNNSQTGYAPCGMVFDDTENVYAFFEDSGGARDYAIFQIDGTLTKAAATFDTSGGYVVGVSTGATSIAFWYNQDSTYPRMEYGTATTAGTSLGGAVIMTNTLLASDAWRRNGKNYFTVVFKSDTQPTYFVMEADTSGNIQPVAKLAPKEGKNASSVEYYANSLPNIGSQSSDVINIPLLRANGLTDSFGSLVNKNGVALSTITYKTANEFPHVPLGDSALIGGGYLYLYDGRKVVENGWHLYPEIVALTESNSFGSIANGTYSYKCVFEWVDANGRLHRSEPSVASSVTTTGANDTVTIDIKSINGLTKRDSVEARVVAYRTQDSGTTYYRLTEIDVTALDTTGEVSIVDGDTDAEIAVNEVLYTNGGEYNNEQPPACGHLATYKNRVWATDLEDGSRAWYSKIRTTNNDPYSFNEALQLTVGDAGRVLASQAIDDKLTFFKENQVLYTYGEGPDNLGANGFFAEASDVNFDGGMSEVASLVRFPKGIIWKHQRGFYAMGGDINPQYIGKGVEDFNDETVTSAVLIPSKNQIRWTHSAGSILAFDYYHQQWYEYSDLQCSGATIRDGKHVIVSSNNVYEQDDSAWTDGGTSFNFLVQTGWISLAGLSGFKRVYKIFFEAEYKADHDLTITVDMEQDGTVYTDTYTIDAATVSGGTDTYRWEVQLSRQKCSSIRVKIEDTSLAGTEQSLNIINMSMLVGAKVGGPKFASAKQIG